MKKHIMESMHQSHYSNFPPEWWNERRKRDYYIDKDGLVALRVGSWTGRKVAIPLRVEEMKIRAALVDNRASWSNG